MSMWKQRHWATLSLYSWMAVESEDRLDEDLDQAADTLRKMWVDKLLYCSHLECNLWLCWKLISFCGRHANLWQMKRSSGNRDGFWRWWSVDEHFTEKRGMIDVTIVCNLVTRAFDFLKGWMMTDLKVRKRVHKEQELLMMTAKTSHQQKLSVQRFSGNRIQHDFILCFTTAEASVRPILINSTQYCEMGKDHWVQ